MKILLTGSRGFIGTHVRKLLVQHGHKVDGVDCLVRQVHGDTDPRRNGQRYKVEDGGTEFVSTVKNAAAQYGWPYDTVIHLAAEVGVGQSQYEPARYVETNALETVQLWQRIIEEKRVGKVVVASSMSLYGEGAYAGYENGGVRRRVDLGWDSFQVWTPPNGKHPSDVATTLTPVPTTETKPAEPQSVYAMSKYDTEQYSRILGRTYDIPTVALRFFNCYDDQTEILTASGFKLFRDLTNMDEVATLNPDSHKVEYHIPVAWQRHHFVGNLVRFNSRTHDLCVTPEHKLFVRSHNTGYRFETAESVKNKKSSYHHRFKACADGWDGLEIDTYDIPAMVDSIGRTWGEPKSIPMALWAEFLGWFISEGSAFVTSGGQYIISISQYRHAHPEHHDRIVALLGEMGFNPYVAPGQKEARVCSKQLYLALDALGLCVGQRNRAVPPQFKRLSSYYLSVLFDALMKGDGDRDGNRYSTISRQLADDVAEICLKTGRTVTTHVEERCPEEHPEWSPIYRCSISERREPQLGDNQSQTTYVEDVPYGGYVYDVTVENHIIFVRRNGKGCWSSNCYGPGQALSNPYTGVLAGFACRVLHGNQPLVFEDGNQSRDFVYVDDVARAVVAAVEAPDLAGTYNVCTGRGTSILELANLWCELAAELGMPKVEPLITGQFRKGDVRHCIGSNAALGRDTGWKPQVELRDGLRMVAEWILANRLHENLPEDKADKAVEELVEKGLLNRGGD